MANHSHKRDTNARRTSTSTLVAAPVAAAVTLGAVGFGVIASDPGEGVGVVAAQNSFAQIVAERQQPPVTRSAGRAEVDLDGAVAGPQMTKRQKRQARQELRREAAQEATQQAVANADEARWSTTSLNLWKGAGEDAEQDGTLDAREKVMATGRTGGDRAEIVIGEQAYWVTAEYLTDEKPPAGPSSEPCANGVSATGGPNVQKVLRATCAFAPELRSYGGNRASSGDHGRGRALDIMVRGERGWQIAEFLREHYRELGISYLIYEQKMWSVQRSGEGWRGMSNRGSDTANHYDHVHVSVY